ncbi:hypothetical protein CTI12_AA630110 [Artemisia annua]|uniref:Uncharacterized protein n=1 Tax=Artemisia annua TaxID=35608 RepID=A0A2U1K931_ARTAN|nr:hypothetical protein CTI12_AA630110 [Artemisia annua]
MYHCFGVFYYFRKIPKFLQEDRTIGSTEEEIFSDHGSDDSAIRIKEALRLEVLITGSLSTEINYLPLLRLP